MLRPVSKQFDSSGCVCLLEQDLEEYIGVEQQLHGCSVLAASKAC